MNNKSITDFIKPTIITAQQYGTKVSVEIDHSDTSIDELFDAFQTICIGLGYHENSFKNWITQRAEEYIETDAEDLKEKLEAWKFEDDNNDVRHRYNKDSEGFELDELENDFFGPYDIDEKRMDIIGQNGNEGLHYRATQEDEDEFDDYVEGNNEDSVNGGFDGNPYKKETGTTYFTVPVNFYTDDEGNKVYDYEGMADQFEEQLSELDEDAVVMVSVETNPIFKPNQKLVEANERYKSEVKKMNTKKKNNKK